MLQATRARTLQRVTYSPYSSNSTRALRRIQEDRLLAEEVPRYGWIGDDLKQLREACDHTARPRNLFGGHNRYRSSMGGLPTQQALLRDPGVDRGSGDLEPLRGFADIFLCIEKRQERHFTCKKTTPFAGEDAILS
jgi:hypothetical protein